VVVRSIGKAVLSALFALASLAPVAVAENAINIPTDTEAKWAILSVTKRSDGLVEVISRRVGSSVTNYSKRLVDCANSRFMYLGSGDTLEKMKGGGGADSKMAALTEGSVSTYVSAYACQNAR
jgi:hypothetical protein